MRKFRVHVHSQTGASKDVEIHNNRLKEIATDLEVGVDQLTIEDLREEAIEVALNEGIPGLCAYCSGMGQSTDFIRDYDSEWDVDDGDEAVEELPVKG